MSFTTVAAAAVPAAPPVAPPYVPAVGDRVRTRSGEVVHVTGIDSTGTSALIATLGASESRWSAFETLTPYSARLGDRVIVPGGRTATITFMDEGLAGEEGVKVTFAEGQGADEWFDVNELQ